MGGDISANPDERKDVLVEDPKVQRMIEKVNRRILDNREKGIMLGKRQINLEGRINKATEEAKNYARNNKRNMAKQCLLRRKQLQAQYDTLENQKNNIEEVTMKLEQQLTNMQVLASQKDATQIMQLLKKEMGDVEDVQDVMDDLKEGIEDINETSRALGENLMEVDDEELDEEFKELQAEAMDEEMSKVNPSTHPLESKLGAKQPEVTEEVNEELDKEYGELLADLN